MSQRIAITGMGVVSPIGIGVAAYWEALLARRSGISVRPGFEELSNPYRLWAPVRDFDGRQFIKPRKALKVMAEPIQFGNAAAIMARDDAGIEDNQIDPDRAGTVMGIDAFFADPHDVVPLIEACRVDGEMHEELWGEYFTREIEPLWMLKYLPNMVASHITIAMDARGPSNSVCHGESSGLAAVIESMSLLERGLADLAYAGGTGIPTEWTGMVYRGPSRLSPRVMEPDQAVRPFDVDRDGVVLGQGAGTVVLETEDHARQRKAPIHGFLRGRAMGFANPRQPDQMTARIVQVIDEALASAGISGEQVALVNAHGGGEKQLDAVEAQAIHRALPHAPVVSQKGHYGQIGPGGGVLELIATARSLQENVAPPTLNHTRPGDDCPVQVVTEPTPVNGRFAVKLSLSWTGQIACVVVEAAD